MSRRRSRSKAETLPDPSKAAAAHWLTRCILLGGAAFAAAYAATLFTAPQAPTPPPGMVWIPPGEFLMGSDSHGAPRNETPAHRVRLDGFFMDAHEVTNEQFREFVEATGYVTTAEQPPDWEEIRKQLPPGAEKPPEDRLVAGSIVFTPPAVPVSTDDYTQWWTWTPGASWKHPEGPESNLVGREKHPVIHVSWDDAMAYAKWAGKRLPTEAEWEYASRGGLVGKRFTWGDEAPTEETKTKANIWQGEFPYLNTQRDGFARTAPVQTYEPNGYGLFDMAGNAWEWCRDWYRADAYEKSPSLTLNPQGPDTFWDPDEPFTPKRVTRGGSFLCHVSYCESYRPAARRGTAADSGMSHLGFRCVQDAPKQ